MQTAIIYTRVSTDDQAENGFSLRDQKDKLEKYCEAKGIEILKHFEDDGYSAKTFNRPEFENLIDYIKKNKGVVKKLLFVKWDRFSRNTEASLGMITKLHKLGVEVEAIEQKLDNTVPENLLMKMLYLAIPEVENARRSLNTTNGMRRAMKEGRYMGIAPFGYKNSRDEKNRPIIVHSDLAPLIKKAFEMYATGMYQIEILRKELYKMGLEVSRNQFWLLLRNSIYCGKLKIKAFGDEPEEIVQGIHEPIISEALFYEVQDVLAGKRKITTKYARVNDEYPMRGFMVCSKCGKNLTGSSSKGNGGTYYYYHCTKGCNERFKSVNLHSSFENWLGQISFNPKIGALYLAIMEDVFKTNEGDRDAEIKKLDGELQYNKDFLDKATEKFITGDLDKDGYNRMKENTAKKCAGITNRIAELKSTDSGFKEYTKYGVSLLSNLKQYYSSASLENKQKMLGLIFPEKLVYSNYEFQTIEPNEILTLLCSAGKGFSDFIKGKSSKNAAHSYGVTALGFKPKTF